MTEPKTPPGFTMLIEAWMDAAIGRSGGGGMGPAGLSWIDIKAMQDFTGRELTGAEARAVLALDRAYLGAAMGR